MSKINSFEGEVWKDIPILIGTYQASSFGRIRSVDRITNCNGGKRFRSGIVLTLHKDMAGYYRITHDKKGTKLVHRLVASAFIQNPDPANKTTINHKNGIRHDNRIENLEWVTLKENVIHSYRELGRKGPIGKNTRAVIAFDGVNTFTFNSIKDAAIFFNTSPGVVHGACTRPHKLRKFIVRFPGPRRAN